MNYEDREEEFKNQEKTSEKEEFSDIHKQEKPDEKILEKSDRRKPEKNPSMIFTVFALSTAFPLLGLILYTVWKEDEPLLARASLIGFFVNIILIAFTVLS